MEHRRSRRGTAWGVDERAGRRAGGPSPGRAGASRSLVLASIALFGCGPSPRVDAPDGAAEVSDAGPRDVADALSDARDGAGPQDATAEVGRDASGADATTSDAVADGAVTDGAEDAGGADVGRDTGVVDAGPPGGPGARCRARIPACAPGYPGTLCDAGLVCVDEVCVAGLPSGAPCGGGIAGRCAEESACLDDGPGTVAPTCRPRGTLGSECIFTAFRSCDLGGSTDFVCSDGLVCSPTTLRCVR